MPPCRTTPPGRRREKRRKARPGSGPRRGTSPRVLGWFAAHEAWETAWKQARDTDEAELFKGLSQMGAGYVHLFRGNAHGAATLLRRAALRIARYEDGSRDV